MSHDFYYILSWELLQIPTLTSFFKGKSFSLPIAHLCPKDFSPFSTENKVREASIQGKYIYVFLSLLGRKVNLETLYL
jgi:hypothetical protein